MERIIKLKEPVLSTLTITNNSLNCISDGEWEVVYSACELLKVFDELTTEMSAENVVTISKQNLFYIFLLEHLDTFINDINIPTNVNAMALEIKSTLNKYLKNLESNDIHHKLFFYTLDLRNMDLLILINLKHVKLLWEENYQI